jgi:hypothetical protein
VDLVIDATRLKSLLSVGLIVFSRSLIMKLRVQLSVPFISLHSYVRITRGELNERVRNVNLSQCVAMAKAGSNNECVE